MSAARRKRAGLRYRTSEIVALMAVAALFVTCVSAGITVGAFRLAEAFDAPRCVGTTPYVIKEK